MKSITNTLVTKTLLIFVSVLLLTITASAQNKKAAGLNVKPNAVANLISGINSENEGVRRSAIYFAGKYEIDQTVESLIAVLKKEKTPSLRILIVLALYKIGNEKGFEAIYSNALLENDSHVKRMCNAIVEEYSANMNSLISSTY